MNIDHYIPNTALFTTSDCDEGLADAKAYIKARGYTKADVKLVRRSGVIQVITIRRIEWASTRTA